MHEGAIFDAIVTFDLTIAMRGQLVVNPSACSDFVSNLAERKLSVAVLVARTLWSVCMSTTT